MFPSKTTPGVADQADYEQYLYDPAGSRTSLRKRDGSVLTLHYDQLNRVTAKIVPGGAANVGYTYDLRGLQTSANFTTTGGGVTNAYDGFGRLTSTTTHMGGSVRTVSHQYDREGAEVETTFPDGQKFWTARDGLGRMKEGYQGPLGDSSVQMTVFHYDWTTHLYYFGRRWGSASYYEHGPSGGLSRLDQYFNTEPGRDRSDFTYNPAGQLRSETRANAAYAWTGSVAVNRPYSVNGQNQYTAAGGASFTYDANGNLTSDGTTSFTYDVENRLVLASGTLADSKNASLVYDPLGRLFQISSPATGTTQFLHDGDQLVAEYNDSGVLQRRYIHGDGSDDPLYWFEGAGFAAPRFPHANHQGSIVSVAEPGGVLLAINTYDEYGIPGLAQRAATALGSHGRFQYTGQAWLPELGMYYYKARIYSPGLGRFLQVDPIGYDDQVNLYAYVGNDPLNRTDPTGTQTSFELATQTDTESYLNGRISEGDFRERQQARTTGGLIGAGIVASAMFAPEAALLRFAAGPAMRFAVAGLSRVGVQFSSNVIRGFYIAGARAIPGAAQAVKGGLSAQAKFAFNSRAQLRNQARGLMSRRDRAALDAAEPRKGTFEDLVGRHMSNGKTRDDAYREIIQSSGRTDPRWNTPDAMKWAERLKK